MFLNPLMISLQCLLVFSVHISSRSNWRPPTMPSVLSGTCSQTMNRYRESLRRGARDTCTSLQLSDAGRLRTLTGLDFHRQRTNATCLRRWMTLLGDKIGLLRLGELMIPGTHNSASFSISPAGTLIETSPVFKLALSLGFSKYFCAWARNHGRGLRDQLEAGFRFLDLRIASVPSGHFRWWHGMTGDLIKNGIEDVASFAEENPQEVIILDISHLNSPGKGCSTKNPMSLPAKFELGRYLLSVLEPYLVSTVNRTHNPTVRSILSSGRNVIALVTDDEGFVKLFPEYFWSDVNRTTTVHTFNRKSNPRSMFHDRCEIVERFQEVFPDKMTVTSAFVTHSAFNVAGGILRNDKTQWVFSSCFLLFFLQLYKSEKAGRFSKWNSFLACRRRHKSRAAFRLFYIMTAVASSLILGCLAHFGILGVLGFEAKAQSLLEMARIANLCGTSPFDAKIESSGINDMIQFWSDRYKLNVVLIDDFQSSLVVATAILENIRRSEHYNKNSTGAQFSTFNT